MSDAPSTPPLAPASTPSTPPTPSTPAAHAEPSLDVPPPQREPLFSAAQIAFATVAATPLAGALLAAANARAIGGGDMLRAGIVATGAMATALIFGVDVWGAGPFTLLALPVSALAAYAASSLAFARWLHRAARRGHAAVGVVVVACWLGLGLVGGATVGALHLYTPSVDETLGDSVVHSPRERVSFEDDARRGDAEQVARALAAAGVFTGSGRLRVIVDDGGDALRVTLPVADDVSLEDLEAGRVMLKKIARHIQPPRCVRGRVVTTSGIERANGRLCP